jgi:3-hydroxyacyl-CoA dehydrogenase/3-hydroxy-2-methylbutyryl-CoA dehydrogenase
VSIVDRSPPSADVLSSKHVKFFQTDITVLAEVAKAVDGSVEWATETGAALGGVINCAGVGTAAKIIDAHGKAHSFDLWDFTLAVNLTGSFNLTRLVLEHLTKVEPEPGTDGERGVVIFVASAAAVSGFILIHNLRMSTKYHFTWTVRRPTRTNGLFGHQGCSRLDDAPHGA